MRRAIKNKPFVNIFSMRASLAADSERGERGRFCAIEDNFLNKLI
jgi:hypothetical protein